MGTVKMFFALCIALIAAIFIILVFVIGPVMASPRDRDRSKQANESPGLRVAPADYFSPPAMVGGRPSGCPLRRWCGCFLQHYFGLADKTLWNARRWAGVGRPAAAGCVGCIAVLSRGNGGHVGIVRGYDGANPIILSGNHNNSVGTATYPRSRVIAYRYL